VALGGAAMLAAPAPSLADGSLTLSVSSDPVSGLPIHYMASGTTPGPDAYGSSMYELNVVIRPASFGPCGSDAYLDPSQRAGDDTAGIVGQQDEDVPDQFAYSWTIPANLHGTGVDTTTMPLGAYIACAWLDDTQTSGGPVATATASFSLRAGRFTMKLSAPSHPRLGGRGTFSAHGTAEIPAHVTVYLLPGCLRLRRTLVGIRCAGQPVRGCQGTPEAEATWLDVHSNLGVRALSLTSRDISPGSFSIKRTVRFGRGWIPGRHTVCAWIGITSSDGDPDQDVYLAKSASFNPRP
jgi:hypothetical protein